MSAARLPGAMAQSDDKQQQQLAAIAYFSRLRFPVGMTDNDCTALEGQGVVTPVATREYQAQVSAALQARDPWTCEELSWEDC